MAPLSLRPIGNPDSSLFNSNSSPSIVNSASCVTPDSIHFFVFPGFHPCQITITSHLDHCFMYDLALAFFCCLIFLTFCLSTLQNSHIELFRGLVRCCVLSPLSSRSWDKLFLLSTYFPIILVVTWLTPLILQSSA